MTRLLVDLERLLEHRDLGDRVRCEYLYHRVNEGELSLLETAEFAVYCRRCREAFCTKACPKEALEKEESGTVRRYNLRCIGCGSCVLACPFGTIAANVMTYAASKCDLCLNQRRQDAGHVPLCVRTAPEGALRLVENAEEAGDDVHAVNDHLAVKAPNWRAKEGKT